MKACPGLRSGIDSRHSSSFRRRPESRRGGDGSDDQTMEQTDPSHNFHPLILLCGLRKAMVIPAKAGIKRGMGGEGRGTPAQSGRMLNVESEQANTRQAYTQRIEELHNEAALDGIEVSRTSERDFWSFVRLGDPTGMSRRCSSTMAIFGRSGKPMMQVMSESSFLATGAQSTSYSAGVRRRPKSRASLALILSRQSSVRFPPLTLPRW